VSITPLTVYAAACRVEKQDPSRSLFPADFPEEAMVFQLFPMSGKRRVWQGGRLPRALPAQPGDGHARSRWKARASAGSGERVDLLVYYIWSRNKNYLL
jgi:hypothetical protein